MSGSVTVRTHGLRELHRDFGRYSKTLQRGLTKQLRKLAGPAAEHIQAEAESHGFSDATISGIRPGSRSGAAVVRQARRKTTGSRPDFGSIQFRWAFIPGADKAEPEVLHGVEEWLGTFTAGHGMGGMF